MLLTTSLLHERGLGDLGPIALDELETLTKRSDWGEPGEPSPSLLKAAKAAVKRTKAKM